ncbi:MAG: BMP family ABC transporter substrate-binding protein [Lachnospiraceae bacterium]|nr:BMP family ABC transporter substrate-binding protein [Lachnospiraceae bacterium]
MKKFLSIILAATLIFSLAACGETTESTADSGSQSQADQTTPEEAAVTVKAGFICLHDEQSTYDLNFINAAKEACEKLGIEYVIKTGIDESEECLTAAEELVEDEGCNYIFADSFGHEPFIMQAAEQYPEVQFVHATGTHAHNANIANFHNAFAAIYEGRYLAGVAAGLKLNEMIADGTITAEQAKVGYVGAFPYAEVISGYTSWFLGVRSQCPTVTMEVSYTSSWYDESAEYETAKSLIANGCVLISQHADSMGAPRACEESKVPNVSYNGSTKEVGPTTFIVSSRINWVPFFEYSIGAVMAGESFDADWTGTIATGSVVLTEVNTDAAAEGTQEKIDEIKAQFEAGTLRVFDTTTFTKDGVNLTSYLADVDDAGDYQPETEVIADGYFHESEYRSAPYFDIIIDGITVLGQ